MNDCVIGWGPEPVPEHAHRTLYIGVDEAGYGPSLGPLVVACVAFHGPHQLAQRDWWQLLGPALGRSAKHAQFVLDDSKRVLSATRGRERLGRTVRAFLGLLGHEFTGLAELLPVLDLNGVEGLHAEHWFPNASSAEPAEPSDRELLERILAETSLCFAAAQVRMVFPAEFNARLAKLSSKAELELAVVRELLLARLAASAADVDDVVVWVDRLGGRRYYRPLIEDLAGESFPQTIEEAGQRSVYRFTGAKRNVEVSFEVKGDQRFLPVALASMLAKYLREQAMAAFNAFWVSRMPGLVPTAGYPVDARRFLEEIRPHIDELGINIDTIWRRR